MKAMQEQLQFMEVSEIRLSYSRKVKKNDRIKITSSSKAEQVFRSAYDRDNAQIDFVELFYAAYLDRGNGVLAVEQISKGGVSGTVADPKTIFSRALLLNASGVILCHNHPSGNTKPSYADETLTKQLKEGGKVLEISVLDHIILTGEAIFSFADESMM
jgi:DNA repair protein RadC